MKITSFDFHNSLEIKDGVLNLTIRDFKWFKEELESLSKVALEKHGTKKPDELIKVIVLDTETTGIEDDDEVIELCMADIYLLKETYEFYSLGLITDELREPLNELKRELTPLIVDLTGLTTEMIKGKHIDNQSVVERLETADLIIAHNAKFDRNQVSRMLGNPESLAKKIWGCSFQHIPWQDLGFLNSKQATLLIFHGIIFKGHRADSDVAALTWLLSKFDYFKIIIEEIKAKKVLVSALNSAFETKDLLSQKYRFSWDAVSRVKSWRKIISLADFENIKDQMNLDIYRSQVNKFHLIPLKPYQLLDKVEDIVRTHDECFNSQGSKK